MNLAVKLPFDHKAPTNEVEFRKYMEAMDWYFSCQRMPIPTRQLAAIAEACQTMGRTVPVPQDRAPQPNSYDGEDLLLRVEDWYEERYGDALKVYLGPGPGLLPIRGAP